MKRTDITAQLDLALTSEQLVEKASKLVKSEGIRYSEAIIDICKEYDLEPEDIVQLLPKPLLEKLENEAMDFHTLTDTRGNSLPGL